MSGFRLSKRARSGMVRGHRTLAVRDQWWAVANRWQWVTIAQIFGVPRRLAYAAVRRPKA